MSVCAAYVPVYAAYVPVIARFVPLIVAFVPRKCHVHFMHMSYGSGFRGIQKPKFKNAMN